MRPVGDLPTPSATADRDGVAVSAAGEDHRETREREAARLRARAQVGSADPFRAPDLPGLDPSILYTLLSQCVRDYAIFLLDADGFIRYWGEGARLMKWWTPAEAEGAHLSLLYPDGGAEDGTADSHLRIAAESGEYTGEGHRVRRDGSTFWAYVVLTALRGSDGRLLGYTKMTRDFSARRAVEAALLRGRPQAAQQIAAEARRLKHVIANLSHELRTPTNAIVGSIALLDEQFADADRVHIDRLHRSSRHLLAILDDVLELSRAESGQLSLSSDERRLGPVIDEALADIETQARGRGVRVVNAVSGGASDVPYWGDDGRVRQILVNLLTNAIKFTDPGGRITISGGTGQRVTGVTLAGTGPWVYVRVEDTGRGIPPARLESIFEPFQQSELVDQQRGTGLGLTISRQLARLMGGDLSAESEPGSGSRFTLWLPIAALEPVPR